MMKSPVKHLSNYLIFLFLLFFLVTVHVSTEAYPITKIEPILAVNSSISNGILVQMNTRPDFSAMPDFETKVQKGEWVYTQLTSLTNESQANIQEWLNEQQITYQSFWIDNVIWVHSTDTLVISQLASREDVAQIFSNLPITTPQLKELTPSEEQPILRSIIPWNLTQIKADTVWDELNVTGTGIVIGGQDTGYDWEHEALRFQYRGVNGTNVNHNYNWHDAIKVDPDGDNVCGVNSQAPCDDSGHGTHTMGVVLGNDGDRFATDWPHDAAHMLGVAPGASWIGCRNMLGEVGSPATYLDCFQWFLAPTDLADENPEPSLSPHIINNSWECNEAEGCTSAEVLNGAIASIRQAGIFMVSAAGNRGPSCETVQYAPNVYGESFTVGSSNQSNAISTFSNRGPVTVDGSNRLKPDLVAPGEAIISADTEDNGTYTIRRGTSMASPHISGVIALMLDVNPRLIGKIDLVESLLRASADPIYVAQQCGTYTGDVSPNAVAGHGLVNAHTAVLCASSWDFETRSCTISTPLEEETPNISTTDEEGSYSVVLTDDDSTDDVDFGYFDEIPTVVPTSISPTPTIIPQNSPEIPANNGITMTSNCDEKWNLLDIIFIKKYDALYLQAITDCADFVINETVFISDCDRNFDGKCSVLDAIIIQQCNAFVLNAYCEGLQLP